MPHWAKHILLNIEKWYGSIGVIQHLQNHKDTSYQTKMKVSNEFDNEFENSTFNSILGKFSMAERAC